jgi:hypothetical protein
MLRPKPSQNQSREGRPRLAQCGSAGKRTQKRSSPGGTVEPSQHVRKVRPNTTFFQKLEKLVLLSSPGMMRRLVRDIFDHVFRLRGAHAESAIPFLPKSLPAVFVSFIHFEEHAFKICTALARGMVGAKSNSECA